MVLDPTVWVWLPLISAILFGFTSHKPITNILLAFSMISAFAVGRIDAFALAISVVLLSIAYSIPKLINERRYQAPVYKTAAYVGWSIVVLLSALLFMHKIPGFYNLLVLNKVYAGPDSIPFSMYLNLDKPIAFFALLFAYPTLLGDKGRPNGKGLLITIALLASLLPVASLIGALQIEVGLPDWWWIFAINNLMITCVAEEALFRGLIQKSLSERYVWWIGLLVASLLFGLAHIAGGPLLMLFATFAGIGYGLIFHFTGRLWCSVLAHFSLNFAHLVLFTYPIAAQ
ncbi:CPBP family intramembrane glutamic endopeptidase [Vibrio ziniensis]|uniref:CPBP family intramembrane metalloprotease n=1 Tax=Vibrio ziniensis TaxID=2711221 RepID=A0A6G7CQ85_9VIBR|nr:type II CAAX endopeptidase family protein [Vibrio ziniensis]QIH44244.1 CPBP family intramembrane metalloprotease [Vibrio ziniensis]